jgi:hypothetical protein
MFTPPNVYITHLNPFSFVTKSLLNFFYMTKLFDFDGKA